MGVNPENGAKLDGLNGAGFDPAARAELEERGVASAMVDTGAVPKADLCTAQLSSALWERLSWFGEKILDAEARSVYGPNNPRSLNQGLDRIESMTPMERYLAVDAYRQKVGSDPFVDFVRASEGLPERSEIVARTVRSFGDVYSDSGMSALLQGLELQELGAGRQFANGQPILEKLRGMSPQEMEWVREAYNSKLGGNFDADVVGSMTPVVDHVFDFGASRQEAIALLARKPDRTPVDIPLDELPPELQPAALAKGLQTSLREANNYRGVLETLTRLGPRQVEETLKFYGNDDGTTFGRELLEAIKRSRTE